MSELSPITQGHIFRINAVDVPEFLNRLKAHPEFDYMRERWDKQFPEYAKKYSQIEFGFSRVPDGFGEFMADFTGGNAHEST